jgi:hypothetical protein
MVEETFPFGAAGAVEPGRWNDAQRADRRHRQM